jgi:hypothetical protein
MTIYNLTSSLHSFYHPSSEAVPTPNWSNLFRMKHHPLRSFKAAGMSLSTSKRSTHECPQKIQYGSEAIPFVFFFFWVNNSIGLHKKFVSDNYEKWIG